MTLERPEPEPVPPVPEPGPPAPEPVPPVPPSPAPPATKTKAPEERPSAQAAGTSEEQADAIYERVLAEERARGASEPVAIARAKAARRAAIEGTEIF